MMGLFCASARGAVRFRFGGSLGKGIDCYYHCDFFFDIFEARCAAEWLMSLGGEELHGTVPDARMVSFSHGKNPTLAGFLNRWSWMENFLVFFFFFFSRVDSQGRCLQ